MAAEHHNRDRFQHLIQIEKAVSFSKLPWIDAAGIDASAATRSLFSNPFYVGGFQPHIFAVEIQKFPLPGR